jgi:tetratricopeptide (TPR) repeat protein
LKDYSDAIRLDQNYSVYHYNRGLTYFKIENTNQAIIDFTKAIEINPNYADAY